MIKNIYYTYLGTNGTVTTPVFLENIYSVKTIELIAEPEKVLTKDNGKTFYLSIKIPESEMEQWKEIDIPGQI